MGIISVIGGAGFLGTRLSKRFERSNVKHSRLDINVLDNDLDIKYFNIEEPHSEHFQNTNCIINLAAMHRDDVRPISRYDDVNVQGSKNICDIARKNKIEKIIFTSSVAIYGFAPPETGESGEPNYFNDYGRTKYEAEKIYKAWQNEDPNNRTLVIIRPTVIFGEGNRGNVYNLLNQIASRRFVMFGNGKNRKSMAYVENVAAFLEYSISFKPGVHTYNYIDKPDFDMNKLVSLARKALFDKSNTGLRLPGFLGIFIGYSADLLSKILKVNLPVSSIRVKKFMGTTQFSSSLSETGFIAPIALEDGLAKTLQYEFIDDNSDSRTFDTE
jgi:nucleoside-diphosphate-sugar epimerase